MTIRQLTPEERARIAGKRKPEGQRPRIYDASTGLFTEISFDFETLILLIPVGFRARIGQYLAGLLATSFVPGTLDDLRTRWLTKRHADYDSAANSYGSTVTTYADIRSDLVTATTGFEDVVELQRLMADLNRVVAPFISTYDSLTYQRSVTNVLKTRSESGSDSNPIQTELQSFVQAMLLYP